VSHKYNNEFKRSVNGEGSRRDHHPEEIPATTRTYIGVAAAMNIERTSTFSKDRRFTATRIIILKILVSL
jgi:hypothetical protein